MKRKWFIASCWLAFCVIFVFEYVLVVSSILQYVSGKWCGSSDDDVLEYRTNRLARKAGLRVPETKSTQLSEAGTTFFSKRFDRDGARRIPYASAMTMLGATDGDSGHSYLEIAEFLSANGANPDEDLRELWSRMAFSQLVRNTDDHLRNHGFLLTAKGWRLAPMFDVNPNPDGGENVLDMGDLFRDAEYYRLTQAEARDRYRVLQRVVEGSAL